jgi:hypothetical protein
MPEYQDIGERFEVVSGESDTRFGPLMRARRIGEQLEEWARVQLFTAGTLTAELLDALADKTVPHNATPHLVGGFVARITQRQQAWMAWESVDPSLFEVLSFTRQLADHRADRVREALFPIFGRIAEAVDDLVKAGVRPEQVTFSPDYIWLNIPGSLNTKRGWAAMRENDWQKAVPLFLPVNLDLLVPGVMTTDADRRLAWLEKPLLLRFAALVYSAFAGPTHLEGCPKSKEYSPAGLLGSNANATLRRCFENQFPETLFGSAKELFALIARPEGKRVEQSARRAVAQEPTTQAAQTDEADRLSEHRAHAERRARRTRQALIASAVAAVGTGVYLASRIADSPLKVVEQAPMKSPPGPGPIPASSKPQPTPKIITPPVSVAQPTVPFKPTSVPVQDQARQMIAENKIREAELLLLSEASAKKTGSEKVAMLRQAVQVKSVRAAQLLAEELAKNSTKEAASMYWQGYVLSKDPKAISQPDTTKLCLDAAVKAKYAPALAEAGRNVIEGGGDVSAGIDMVLQALDVFEKGNAVTDAEPAKRSDIIAILSTPVALAALEKRAASAGQDNPADADRLAKLAFDCGGSDACVLLVDQALAGKSDYSTVAVAEMDKVIQLLREGERRGSTSAMVRLSDLFSDISAKFTEKTDPTFSAQQRRNLLQKAADLDDKSAVFGMGNIYLQDKDYVKAVSFFKRAESLGVPNAGRMAAFAQQQASAAGVVQ